MKLNFSTESLARRAGSRPWTVIGIWLVVVVAALMLITTLLGDALTTEDRMTNNPESMQADSLMGERLGGEDTTGEMIIVRSTTFTVDDPEFRSQVEGLFADLTSLGDEVVLGGTHYYEEGDESLVSDNRHSTFIPLAMPAAGAEEVVGQVHEVVDRAGEAAGFEVLATGEASFGSDALRLAEDTMSKGETIGISVALVVLTLVFGAVAAALLPVALGIVSVVAALGLAALIGQTIELSFFVTNMVTMMGLAVGIDYSLFIVSRYREEREKGLEKIDAIAAAGATASRAVLFSGMTVVLALSGLLIFPLSVFQSAGIGAISVVVIAVLASLTLLPAMLGLLGDRINRFRIRIPFVQRRKSTQSAEPTGFWVWTTRMVTRRPVVSLVIAGSLLVAALVPFFDKNTGMSGIASLPDDLRSKQGFIALQEDFGFGQDAPAIVVIDGQTDSEAVQAAIADLEAAVASDPAFVSSELVVHPEAALSILSARLAGDPMAALAMDAVAQLRAEYIPAAFADAPAEALVTGQTAGILDFNETTAEYTPVIFGFVLALSFVLLTVAFRSVVIPATSILMNLLSVGAAYGLIVLVFQKGIGASIFGFQQVDVIESWLPLFLFAILFGLSMDYHVFLLSRIRERFRQTGDNAEAVSFGLRSTGRLITGAALIMVAVFGGFALGDLVMLQQMGFGLAVAVFVDATIVRSVLVPATMKILGRHNWYLPRWLEWMPNVSIGEGGQETVETTGGLEKGAPAGRPVLAPAPVIVLEELATVPVPVLIQDEPIAYQPRATEMLD